MRMKTEVKREKNNLIIFIRRININDDALN